MKTPVYKRSLVCPSCNSRNDQYYIPDELYQVTKQEEDQHPIEYRWYEEEFKNFFPQYFKVMACPVCFYADLTTEFLKDSLQLPVVTQATRRVRDILSVKKQSQDEAYLLLGTKIDASVMTFNMSLNLHLLAIFTQELLEEELRNNLKLGELYLRTAWLFREISETHFHTQKKPDFHAFDNVFSEYYNTFKGYQKKLNYFRYHIHNTLQQSDLASDFKAPYYEGVEGLISKLDELEEFHAELMNLQEFSLIDYHIRTEEIQMSEAFKLHDTMQEFMKELKSCWTYAPFSENMCLQKSCEYYIQELEEEGSKLKYKQRQSIAKRTIIIKQYMGLYIEAIELAEKAMVQTQEYISIASRRLHRVEKRDDSSPEIESLSAQLHTARLDEQNFEKIINHLNKLQNKKNLSVANDIIKTYSNASPDELKKHFIAAGIDHQLAKKFIHHVLANREQKRLMKEQQAQK